VYTYGDVYKLMSIRPVKGASSLEEARALGADVVVVTSLIDAAKRASSDGRDSVFLGVGFETVAPGYARAIIGGLPENLSILSLVKLTPPAMMYSLDLLREKPTEPPVMGVIAPGHVSAITGSKAWEPIPENYGIPVVVAGFEAADVILAILDILLQLRRGEARVSIEYRRVVTREGDIEAQRLVHTAFEVADDAWRGIGFIPKSGLRIRERYKSADAGLRYGIRMLDSAQWRYDLPPGCRCAEVVLGKARPADCPLFMRACTPERPIGPCMVSIEGTCAIWARLGGGGLADMIARSLTGG